MHLLIAYIFSKTFQLSSTEEFHVNQVLVSYHSYFIHAVSNTCISLLSFSRPNSPWGIVVMESYSFNYGFLKSGFDSSQGCLK